MQVSMQEKNFGLKIYSLESKSNRCVPWESYWGRVLAGHCVWCAEAGVSALQWRMYRQSRESIEIVARAWAEGIIGGFPTGGFYDQG